MMKKYWLIWLLGLLGLLACRADVPMKISQADLVKRQAGEKEFLLLDVRSALEYRRGYIKGATWMPHGEIDERVKDLEAFKDKEVVVYCQSGIRSGKAIRVLKSKGFTRVFQLDGDFGAWIRAGRPVAKP
jgi:phage shock protein E